MYTLYTCGSNAGKPEMKRGDARFTLNAKNLLDEEYYEGSFVLADPLKVYASVELKF